MMTAVEAVKLSKDQLQKALQDLGLSMEGEKDVLLVRLVEAIEPTKEDLEEKKRQRSLRFGIPVVDTKPVKVIGKKEVTPTILSPISTKSPKANKPITQKPKIEVDAELAAKRKQKFGQTSPVKEAKKDEY